MDLKANDWHGLLKVSGVAEEFRFSGTPIHIVSQIMKQLVTLTPRKLSGGEKDIQIHLSTQYITQSLMDDQKRIAEVEAMVDNSHSSSIEPHADESMTEYAERLTTMGYSPGSAIYFACDYFDSPLPEKLDLWLTDPLAIQFRAMNASNHAYETANPQEYATLKRHCESNYPEQLALMTLRD